MQRVMIT